MALIFGYKTKMPSTRASARGNDTRIQSDMQEAHQRVAVCATTRACTGQPSKSMEAAMFCHSGFVEKPRVLARGL